MKYVTIERSVSAFRFGKHIPPKWYMDLLNRGKVFASREQSEKGAELKLKIVLPGKTCLVPITNADRISAMSDEELANAMCRNPIFTVCDAVCKGDCKAVDTLNDTKEAVCKRTILEWLQQPAEEDT